MLAPSQPIDGRARSHMGAETRLIHARLEAWASWVRNEMENLGFPIETYLKLWIEYGIDGAQQHGKIPTMPDIVAITDSAVARLGDIDRKVIRAYYLRWDSREVLARRCHMRIREFDAVLKRARWRIEAYIARAEEELDTCIK